jgi:hypothetical protein
MKMPPKMKKILIILSLVFMILIVLASLGIGYVGGVRGVGLLGLCFFLSFGIMVVLAQLIPAGIILSSFVGTTFSSFRGGEVPIRAL